MEPPVNAMHVGPRRSSPFPEPFKSILGEGEWRGLGQHFAPSQFAVNLEVLHPGAQSALRQWHS